MIYIYIITTCDNMQNLPIYIISKNQTAWIRKIIWIILYDFAGCNSIFYIGTTDISFLHSL